ncbi:MAG: helicase C-terminal domain-containing protein [Dehalococcoidia bacterium]
MATGEKVSESPALDQIYVALDLETTGLDPARDTIIEVGAVKFQNDQVIDTFQTFVNPGRNIPEFIQRLTGISPQQVKRAPYFSSVAGELEDFLEAHPIVGHNIAFDLRFLDAHGLKLANPSYDTWDLATMLLPSSSEYSLGYLTTHLGVSHIDPHRALADAQATQGVFVALLRKAAELDPGLIGYAANLASRSRWGVAPLLSGLESATLISSGPSAVGLTGLNLDHLASRLGHPEKRRYDTNLTHLDEGKISELMGPNGPFAKAFEGFEHRPEQGQMLAAVTQAIYQGKHLVVEGGTGVGKSMAYLLPATLFAVSRGQRVVVSTNTINLQEQLIRKDIPSLIGVLEGAGLVEPGLVKAALLKGRANYLCLRRWNYLARSESPSVDDARLLSKTAVWLQDTASGDRGEINLANRDAFTWSKISAGEKGACPGLRDGGPCFLRSARERADQAHIIVVNHALLLSDLAHGGSLIPDSQYLIIDEAHNLEDEATRQFGFQVSPERLGDELELQGRLTTEVRLALRAEGLAAAVRQQGEQTVAEVEATPPRLRDSWATLWAAAERFLNNQRTGNSDESLQILITPAVHSQRAWDDLALAWENVDVGLGQAIQRLAQLQRFLETTTLNTASDLPALTMEAVTIQDNLDRLRQQLGAIPSTPEEDNIHWISRDQSRGEVVLHAAPLEVGKVINDGLFDRKESVVLTSATISTQNTFDYARQRLGIPEESEELLVGSPFDYQKAALLMIPEDMPQPQTEGYIESLSRVLVDLGRSLGGRTMALFTSYSALRAVSQNVRTPLMSEDIQVLAQSIDGSPQQLIRRFTENPRSVLLGTSSFWEGVDLPGETLKALVLTRLPFQVPTDPIVKARSDQYQDSFNDFSIPQAVLRFRQGIGRLIRNKGDKGTIVVLDRRITGRAYGQAFLQSIPPCTLQPSSLSTVGSQAARWIG